MTPNIKILVSQQEREVAGSTSYPWIGEVVLESSGLLQTLTFTTDECESRAECWEVTISLAESTLKSWFAGALGRLQRAAEMR